MYFCIIESDLKMKYLNKTFIYSQILSGTSEKIFPLLCPTKEYEWIAPWKCEMIHSHSGFAELNCVFTTHFPDEVKETWFIDQYIPNRLIQFIRFSELTIIKHSIELTDNQNGTTNATWSQTFFPLNEEGNNFVQNYSEDEYIEEIKTLEKMLNHYLVTNKCLEISKIQ